MRRGAVAAQGDGLLVEPGMLRFIGQTDQARVWAARQLVNHVPPSTA